MERQLSKNHNNCRCSHKTNLVLTKNKQMTSIDLNTHFISDNHIRYNNGVKSDANNKGAYRGILIEEYDDDVFGDNKTFLVSIHNLREDNPIFGNIQMAPKPMKIIKSNDNFIELRGYGYDEMGYPFSDYGIILHLSDDQIEKVTLIMWDRNVRIEYLKA